MGVIVAFNYAAWVARYPEFNLVLEPLATAYFNEATVYCRNDGGGPVSTAAIQSTLLNMLTAHIAWLNAPRDANGNPSSSGSQAASPIVGRISNASEGSVSVGSENNYPPGSAQWFQQSRYGAAYYAATAPYRTMRYIPGSAGFGVPGIGVGFNRFGGFR